MHFHSGNCSRSGSVEPLKVSFHYFSDTFSGANNKAEELLYTSTVDSTDEESDGHESPKRKRQKPAKIQSDDDDEANDSSPSFKKPVTMRKTVPDVAGLNELAFCILFPYYMFAINVYTPPFYTRRVEGFIFHRQCLRWLR